MSLEPADRLQSWREVMTHIIAALVLGVVLGLLVWTFKVTSDKMAVLQLALPLLGTVLGYYFGRTPAEQRANAAQKAAAAAGVQLEREMGRSSEGLAAMRRDVRATVERVEDLVSPEPKGRASVGEPDLERVRKELRDLVQRLG